MDQLLDILCGHSVTSLKLLAIEGVRVLYVHVFVLACVCIICPL